MWIEETPRIEGIYWFLGVIDLFEGDLLFSEPQIMEVKKGKKQLQAKLPSGYGFSPISHAKGIWKKADIPKKIFIGKWEDGGHGLCKNITFCEFQLLCHEITLRINKNEKN